MHVRPATPEDVEDVRRIARAAWEHDYPDHLSRESVTEGLEEWYGREELLAELDRAGSTLLVADHDDAVAGFVHAAWDAAGSEGSLLRVYVDPDHRGAGVGRRLVEAATDALFDRGVERVTAMALAANDPGDAFYRAVGFEPVAEGSTTIAGEEYDEQVYALAEDRA